MAASRLIINADDFGRTREINRAVVRAHLEGVLTSASLMVAGEAADEAIELARQHPTLAVGLHVVVVDGPAVLPADRIPHLVDSRGCFPNAPVRLGLRYAFSRAARLELAAELEAQFRRFADSGLPLSHVDGHQHMHMHPVVFDLLLPLARSFGAHGIRVVRDDLKTALHYDRAHALSKVLATVFFGLLARRCRRRLGGTGMASAGRTYGFLQSGNMSEAYVLSLLRQIDDPLSEIYFHPTEGQRLDPLGPNPSDLGTLLSRAVRESVDARGLVLSRYSEAASEFCRGSMPAADAIVNGDGIKVCATVADSAGAAVAPGAKDSVKAK
jgi:chitin disaccharide deacetylase